MPGWGTVAGSIAGWIFDRLPNKREGRRNKHNKLVNKRTKLLLLREEILNTKCRDKEVAKINNIDYRVKFINAELRSLEQKALNQ